MKYLTEIFKPSPVFADVGPKGPAPGIFGKIENPTKYDSLAGEGLFAFLSNIFILAGTIAGVYLVIQLILAGFAYISASGDPKKAEVAWTKIWQSLLGIVIVSAAFVIAGVVGRFTGINILNPEIHGPNQ